MNIIVLTVEAQSDCESKFAKDGALPIGQFPGLFRFGYGDNIKTDYIQIIGFNGVVEKLQTVKKGETYLVIGSLTTEEYQTEGGAKRKKFKLVATNIQPCCDTLQVNQVSIAGGIGQDPDMKVFDSGSQVVTTSMAVQEKKDKTNWFSVKAWGKTAELIADYVRKGSKLGVVGELQVEHWGQSDDNFKFVVNANQISLLGKSGESKPSVADDDDF